MSQKNWEYKEEEQVNARKAALATINDLMRNPKDEI